MSDLLELDAPAEPAPKKKSQPEWGLSHWVDVFLDRTFIGPGWYTAIEGGTYRTGATRQQNLNAEEKRKARGIKPYHLDWYCYQSSTGIYAQWELKVDKNNTTKGQDDTIAALTRNGIPTGKFYTVIEVCEFLLGAGFVLHGNARGIANELHERYLAKRREVPKKKRSGAGKAVPRFGGTVKQAHKRGAWKP